MTTRAGDPWTVITAAPLPAEEPTRPGPARSAFTVATFNTENFDNPAEPKMNKLVRTIINVNGLSFLALEEVDVARYSYIFPGVSQMLDHVLVSLALPGWLQAFTPLHSNADFPYLPYTYQSSNVWPDRIMTRRLGRLLTRPGSTEFMCLFFSGLKAVVLLLTY